jgi:SAM-dependent methyltransferase
VDLRKVWDARARQWRDWARTPGHDAYWAYRDSFFRDIVPDRPGRTLEIGCGEGRVARSLAERSQAVIAVDSSPTLIAYAAEADRSADYLVGDAMALPFSDGSFDTVVSYNSLMDLDDMPMGVSEAARVMKADGCFCICVLHPVIDAGDFVSDEPDSAFVITSSYLETRRYEDSFERDGLQMTFSSWRYPLSAYADALEQAELLIERLDEPLPDPSAPQGRPDLRRAERVPAFLFLRVVKARR